MMAVRRVRSPFLAHFAIQMGGWGVVIGAIAGLGWYGAQLRDVSGAARLERLLWMNIGLDAGYVAVGAVLALSAWMIARKIAAVGAGVGIVVQGLALLLIDLQFASVISR
ncbi:MAG: putative rane protein [Gemmatimonadetes bacterium]|nr:putative rane protein [Gemmatimonadota bacterium]